MDRKRLEALTGRIRSARRSDREVKPENWAIRRGNERYTGQFDVIGNFPGFETAAGLIVGARIVVTDMYILVDEFTVHGFALRLHELADVSVDANVDSFGDVLVRYLDGDDQKLFRLRPSRSRLSLRGRTDPAGLAGILSELEVPRAELDKTLAEVLSLGWDSAQSVESETVVWSGKVTAPLRPGLECEPGSVWLTRSALIWGSARGDGVNRLPTSSIKRISSVQLDNGKSTPVVYVRTSVIPNVTLELPFIFNRSTPVDAERERDEFVALFHPDIIGESDVSACRQPWSEAELERDNDPVFDEIPTVPANQDSDSSTDESSGNVDTDAETKTAADEVVAPGFETWHNAIRPSTFPYVSPMDATGASAGRRIDQDDGAIHSGSDAGSTRLVQAIASWPGLADPADDESIAPLTATEPNLIISYLARARQSINEVNESIDRRLAGNAALTLRSMPPAAAEQASALTELVELAGTGYYSPEQLTLVKSQLTGFGEAAIRIRSLMELCNAGHMSIAEVGAKRDRIMVSISKLLIAE